MTKSQFTAAYIHRNQNITVDLLSLGAARYFNVKTTRIAYKHTHTCRRRLCLAKVFQQHFDYVLYFIQYSVSHKVFTQNEDMQVSG